MNKSAKQNKQTQLKSHSERSHNQNSQLIAFVKFLARRAAEEDFKTITERMNNPNIKGEEQ